MKKEITTTKRLRIEVRQALGKLKHLPENVGNSGTGRKSGNKGSNDDEQQQLFDKELMLHLSDLYDQRTNVLYCLRSRVKNGMRENHIGKDRWGSRYHVIGGSWARLVIETMPRNLLGDKASSEEDGNHNWYVVETPKALNGILSCLNSKGRIERKLKKELQTILPLLHRTMKKTMAHQTMQQLVDGGNNSGGGGGGGGGGSDGPTLEMYELGGLYGALCPLLYVGGGELPIASRLSSDNDAKTKLQENSGANDWSLLTKSTSLDIFRGAPVHVLQQVTALAPSASSTASTSSTSASSSTPTTQALPNQHRILALRLLLHEIMGMLEPSHIRIVDNTASASLNARSFHTAMALLLEHAERRTLVDGNIYPLACVQLMLENAMKNEHMPYWWVESYRPRVPPEPPTFIDNYGSPTTLVPVKPSGYAKLLKNPVLWRTAVGGHFATAPTMVPIVPKYEEEGLHGVCALLESPTTSLLMVRALALRRAIRESRGEDWIGTEISPLKQCLLEGNEPNHPTRESKSYPDEYIPPLQMLILDYPPPNTRSNWTLRNEVMHKTGPHSARYMEGLEFADELEC